MRRFCLLAVTVSLFAGASLRPAHAQNEQLGGEMQRLQGTWRVVDLVENGQTVPEDQLRAWLPGGGIVDIVDNTLLFKSPVDGHKSTKSFRIDASSYPKKIAIFELDRMTGQGIYEHDGSRLVICVSHPPSAVPTDLSAPAGSNRSMLVLVPYNESDPASNQLQLGPPPIVTHQVSASKPTPYPTPQPAAIPRPTPQPTPVPVPNQAAAGKILTDEQVKQMLVGKWRLDDGSGLIDITFDPREVFSSYRFTQPIQTFNQVFVPTPVSSGTWNVQSGRLFLKITSSWRVDLVNSTITFAVRSISPTDAIIEDNLGRVSRAVRIP